MTGFGNGSTAENAVIINPNEDLQIPAWVNIEYFSDILKQDEPEHVQVRSFKVVAATPPGENFLSIMLRVHIELEMKNGSVKRKAYVLKTMLDADKGGDIVEILNSFPKELAMYRRYLPAFEELYSKAGQHIQFAPRCLLAEQKAERFNFVFEDLKLRNFENVDRLTGLDMAHMRRALQKLAEFHAASVVYAEQNGRYTNSFHYGFVNEKSDKELTRAQFEMRSKAFKKAMPLWDMPDYQKYIKHWPTFEQYWKCALHTFESHKNSFNVLTHGDIWSSNLMMNYTKSGDIAELLLMDFQICKWGSPAEDLIFLITISAAKDIRIKEFEHFIEIYHTHLVESLTLLKYVGKIPKLRDLHMEMFSENASFFAFYVIYNHLPVLLLPSERESNFHSLMRNDEEGLRFFQRILVNPPFVEAMKDIIPFFTCRGLFNFQDFTEE